MRSGPGSGRSAYDPIADVLDSRQYGAVRLSPRSLMVVPTLFLGATTVALTVLYPLAARPLSHPGDEPIIERARSDASLIIHDAETHRRATFPIVMRLADRTCVELRSLATNGAGSYSACYDRKTGKKIEEEANLGF